MRPTTLWTTAVIIAMNVAIAQAALTTIRGSDRGFILIIDGDGDGPDDNEDCTFRAEWDPNTGQLVLIPSQDDNTPLRACPDPSPGPVYSGSLFLSADSSSNYATSDVDSTEAPGSSLPLIFEIVDEVPNPADPNGPIPPLGMDDPLDYFEVQDAVDTPEPTSRSRLCETGSGLALLLFVPARSAVLLPAAFDDEQMPEYLGIPNLPFERAAPNLGSFSLLTAYLPVTSDRHLTLALDTDPNEPFVDIDLANLPSCGSLSAPAPTASGWVLIAVALSLVAFGCWHLGRRRRFYESLPLV